MTAVRRHLAVSIVLGVAMAATSALTGALTPQPRAPQLHERFSLEQMIPQRFGAWTIDPNIVPLQPDPEQQGVLAKIYDQTLSRTYIDRHGQRVMLSIAYGGDQSKALQLHLPEVCYVAQGFALLKDSEDLLPTRYGQLPVKRLVARLAERNEPITYWITIGDKATKAGIQQKLRRLAYGLSGEIPDGMLVRVSTIQANEQAAWRVQDRFVADMLSVLGPTDRAHLIGADTVPGRADTVPDPLAAFTTPTASGATFAHAPTTPTATGATVKHAPTTTTAPGATLSHAPTTATAPTATFAQTATTVHK